MRYSDSPLELTIKAWDIVFLPRINNLRITTKSHIIKGPQMN